MGGTEILLVDLLNHLATKAQITLLLPEPSEKNVLLHRVSPAISVKYLHRAPLSRFKKKLWENTMIFFPRLFAGQKSVSEAGYDEIVCFKESFFACIFARMNIPKILWIHNIVYKRKYETRSVREKLSVWLNRKQLKLTERSYNCFDKVICVSGAAQKAYLSVLHNGKKPKQDIRILHNAIDLAKVKEKAKEAVAGLPQSETGFILVTRISPEKRIDRLIRAIVRLKEEGYHFHVHILGDGTDNRMMREELARKGISELVTLKGNTDNPFPYILQSKWSLCVSERESFSLALLESMALKTPVITTDCGGPRDIVENGKYGILVENSAQGVYAGMKSVLDDPALSVKYSMHLDEAVSRFDHRKWLHSVEKLLVI
jgi:glycosyltransferase involved in cell wall biosynthesis